MAQKRFALCIGNDDYSYLGKLGCAVKDANAVAEALQKLGFDVEIFENTDHEKIIKTIDVLESKITECDAILLFYAGHGFQLNGENLLAPIDFNPAYTPTQAMYCSLRLSDLMHRIDGNSEKTKIIILDACRKEYGTRGFNGREFAPMFAPQGSLIAFSTSPGQVAKENGIHGKYTEIFLRYVDLPREPIESVFKRIRTDLVNETGGSQTPWEHTSLIGDFYLNPGKAGRYSDTALADFHYRFSENSEVESIVRDFKAHYWPDQRKAIKDIEKIDFEKATADELFVLGRNIYQAANGHCIDARIFIEKFDEKEFIPDQDKVHIVNGLVYEIYFDHEDKVRDRPKSEYASKVINLLEGGKYISCCEFISSMLKERQVKVYYLPGSKKRVDVTVKLGNIDTSIIDSVSGKTVEYDGYSVEDIIYQGESIYYNTFDNDKPQVYPYDMKMARFSFESDLTNKMIASEGYIRVNYTGANVGTNTLLLIPDDGYSVFRRNNDE